MRKALKAPRYQTEQDLINAVKHCVHTEYEHETHGYETEEKLLCMVIAYLMAEDINVKSLTNTKLAAMFVKGISPVDTEDVALNWLSTAFGKINADMAFLDPDHRSEAMYKTLLRLVLRVEFFPYDTIAITE